MRSWLARLPAEGLRLGAARTVVVRALLRYVAPMGIAAATFVSVRQGVGAG
jgi:hypothetical protein